LPASALGERVGTRHGEHVVRGAQVFPRIHPTIIATKAGGGASPAHVGFRLGERASCQRGDLGTGP
jgi:hypothetical protein